MSISYDYYRIFYYVAKYKSFTKAAEMLFSNQPNISRIIAKLEKEPFEVVETKSHDGLTLRGNLYEFKKDAPIMIMDDSVSAVDVKTEETILNNIGKI